MIRNNLFKAVAFVTVLCFSFNAFAVSSQIVNSFYNYAQNNQFNKIRYLVKMGYNIDAKDDRGLSAYCLAKENENSHVMTVLTRMGADEKQNCGGIAWGKTAAVVLGVAAVGGGVALAAGGGGGGTDLCASVTCNENASCSGGICSCNVGYLDFGGTCYPQLTCQANAHQESDQCVCDGGYLQGSDGVCYAKIQCQANAHQENDKCVCDGGYTEQNGVCYMEKSCDANATQVGNTCVCNSGYIGDGFTCYQDLNCATSKPNSTQNGNSCVCNADFVESSDGRYCYARMDCQENAHQEDDQCVCNSGYIDQSGVCYAKKECVNGTQEGDTCVCNENAVGDLCENCDTGFGHNGAGACVEKSADEIGVMSKINYNPASVEYSNNKYADFYGLVYDADNPDNGKPTGGGKDYLYNAYANVGGAATEIIQTSKISITNKSDGNVYGIYSTNATNIYNTFAEVYNVDIKGNVSSELNIDNTGNGNVYGMWGNGSLFNVAYTSSVGDEFDVELSGKINITNNGSGSAYGMYSANGTVNNDYPDSSIIVKNTGSAGGDTYGLYAQLGNAENSGSIEVSSQSGIAYGIYSGGGRVINTGTIKVSSQSGSAYGIYADGGNVINTGKIIANGPSANIYGIYATNGATVSNEGTIQLNSSTCNGTTCDGSETNGNFIVLDGESTLSNSALISSDKKMNFNDFGGTMLLARNGKFKASELAGDLKVAADIVQGGFEDQYVAADALEGDKINVDLASASAMFDASLQQGETNKADVVMNRKSFADISTDASIAQFLETNYQEQKNEALFDALKAPNSNAYQQTEADLLGYGLLPNFSRENMNILRNMTSVLNEELFSTEGKERKMVGYDYLYQSRDTKGTLSGYENYANTMYFMYDRELENMLRTGVGMSITQFYSDYDDDSSRKEIMVQALIPLSYKMNNGLHWAAVGRLGYGNGEYKRQTANGQFESDLSEWIYGLSNSVRYGIDLTYVTLEPVAEFNVLGYYQNRIREDKAKTNALSADAVNNLSVESGLGVNLRKEMTLSEHNKLSFALGAMYYHEFAHPYHSLDASIYGMTGSYKVTDYEGIYDRDRGVLTAGFDYDWKDFTFYGKFYQFIEDENPINISAGLKYRL